MLNWDEWISLIHLVNDKLAKRLIHIFRELKNVQELTYSYFVIMFAVNGINQNNRLDHENYKGFWPFVVHEFGKNC